MQAVWLSIQRNHPLDFIRPFLAMTMPEQAHHCSSGLTKPFAYERLFLWRLMHRRCHLSSDVPSLASSDTGKTYNFSTADKLNTLLLNCLLSTGQLKEGKGYDIDFDHQFIGAKKFDAKPTYKKFLGYRPGVAVIGDMIVGIENSDGNFYKFIMARLDVKRFGLKATSRIKAFVFKFISVPAKWVRTSRRYVLNIYSCNNAYADVFQNDFG